MAKVKINQQNPYDAHMLWPPSPIVWVSTVSKDRMPNVAPFSLNEFFSYVSTYPQVIIVGMGGHTGMKVKGKGTKKSFLNIKATGEFVVNIPSEESIEKVTLTGLDTPPEFNKFEAYGLTPIPSKKVKAPSVKEAKVHYECQLMKIDDYGGQTDLVFGKVVAVVADEDVLSKKLEKKVRAIKPVYYYGIGPGKGLYFSAGKLIGKRDDSKNPPHS
ncbi:MAG: flavin reductase family protein [Thaumarchaeota archaeon]|nr:flavin reductase family protein [Nitrososphaerota archaeon]